MPKMFVHSSEGVFSSTARAQVASALTDLGMICEQLADRDEVREGVWTIFTEHAADTLFVGGHPATKPIIALVIYALAGGLDESRRTKMIARATEILTEHASSTDHRVPVYVVIQETPEVDWGMYGQQVALADLRRE